jgi:hypothetical protein
VSAPAESASLEPSGGAPPPPRFSRPSLQGRHVRLRAVVPEDSRFLQFAETSTEVAPRWRLRGATPGPQEWTQSFWRGVLAQFVVVPARGEGSPLGVVAAYQANFQDGHAYLAAARFDGDTRSPLMIFGVAAFIEYVFTCWDFRKLYMDVPEYNYAQLANGSQRFFAMEGRLRAHSYFAGRHWDQLILAIHRERWLQEGSALLPGPVA